MPRKFWKSSKGRNPSSSFAAMPSSDLQMLTPSRELLRRAFAAGFESIDDGDTFYLGFNAFLSAEGYVNRDDIPCTCSDGGAHGHLPECRWVKAG